MIGVKLGNRYELVEKIGEGGMAVVYKAKCHILNRFVAIKILKSEFNKDEEFVEKFKREASASAGLSHNNIVRIFDIGSEDNVNYIVMEYVDGKTLKEIIKENVRLSYSKSVDIAIQIAKALICAHQNGIVHRDIKPQNILVTKEGVVKVADFGIAKASNSVTITNSNKVIGSAHYFSPEQAKGSVVDCRTDIYSLGIVIYEMVTGVVPYDAESPVSVAIMHIQQQVIPPKLLVTDIFDSLNDLILKAIEKDPAYRYQSAVEILNDLEKIRNDPNYVIVSSKNENDYTMVMEPINIDKEIKTPIKTSVVENKKKLSSFKKAALITISFLLLIIIGWGLGAWAGKFNSPGSITIPDIVGLSSSDAKKAVVAAGLVYVEAGSETSDKAKGIVINSSPVQGIKVLANSEVRVTLSSGAKQITVPDVKNINIANAKEIIKNENLTVGNITYDYSDTVPKDSVASQTPNADETASAGDKVDLFVSKGPSVETAEVPDLTGKTFDQAKILLENAGFKVGTATAVDNFTDETQNGLIWLQTPVKGTASKGSAVDFSYYVFKVKVPYFVNSSADSAKSSASKLGLVLKFVDDNGNDVTPGKHDTVTSQDMTKDSAVVKGSVVTLTVNTAQ